MLNATVRSGRGAARCRRREADLGHCSRSVISAGLIYVVEKADCVESMNPEKIRYELGINDTDELY